MLRSVNMYYKKSNSKERGCSGLIYDPEKSNYFITDSYSFIRLNNNNNRDAKRIYDIKEAFGVNDRIKDSIVKHYNNVVNGGFNVILKNFKDIKENELIKDGGRRLMYVKEKNCYFNYDMIKRILNISDSKDATLYISKENDYFLNICTNNSVAYLLCCKSY